MARVIDRTKWTAETDDARPTPHELIRQYGRLSDAVAPLAQLATLSPRMLDEVIELAMAMGIHAAETHAAERSHLPYWTDKPRDWFEDK
jgi:hypothetical protein